MCIARSILIVQPEVPVLLRLAEGGGVPLQSLRGRRRGLRDEQAGGPPPGDRPRPGGREAGTPHHPGQGPREGAGRLLNLQYGRVGFTFVVFLFC